MSRGIATKALNLIIMGAPGGGKGTISTKLIKDFKFNHISTGDLLRWNVNNGTEIGKKAQEFMSTGGLVPDEVVVSIIEKELQRHKGNDNKFLLDGFPRTVAQAELLGKFMHIDAVASLDIPHEVIVSRMENRRIHPASGRTYSLDYKPPKTAGVDDETGEPLVMRDDDKPEVVLNRLQTYDKMRNPLLEYYRKSGESDSTGTGCKVAVFKGTESDVIYPEVKKFVDGLLQ